MHAFTAHNKEFKNICFMKGAIVTAGSFDSKNSETEHTISLQSTKALLWVLK